MQRSVAKSELEVALCNQEVVDGLIVGQSSSQECVLGVLNLEEGSHSQPEALLNDLVGLLGESHTGSVALNLLEIALDAVELSLHLRAESTSEHPRTDSR